MAHAFTTADLYDELGDALDSISLPLLNLGGRVAFTGTARTIRCFRDNGLIKQIAATPGHGHVLVVDGGGTLESALVGDMIGADLVHNGWAGIIINGAVRDRLALARLPLGVKALGSNPRKSVKDGEGELDVPLTFGGATITPGSTVWADSDGVLVTR